MYLELHAQGIGEWIRPISWLFLVKDQTMLCLSSVSSWFSFEHVCVFLYGHLISAFDILVDISSPELTFDEMCS